jgi:hypothetical protein
MAHDVAEAKDERISGAPAIDLANADLCLGSVDASSQRRIGAGVTRILHDLLW